jgi:hypothetical protein
MHGFRHHTSDYKHVIEVTSELYVAVIKENGAYTNHDATFMTENQRH